MIRSLKKQYNLSNDLVKKTMSAVNAKENKLNESDFINIFYKPLRKDLEAVYYKKQLSENFEFFKKIENENIVDIGKRFKKSIYAKGDIICNDDFNTDNIYFLKKGTVNLYIGNLTNKTLINRFFNGCIFNYQRMFLSKNLMFNYVSDCDNCEVYAITIEDFWKIL